MFDPSRFGSRLIPAPHRREPRIEAIVGAKGPPAAPQRTRPSTHMLSFQPKASPFLEHELAVSRELNLAARNLEVPVLVHAAVAARHVWNASSRRTRSVRRDVRWRWTLKVFWTAAPGSKRSSGRRFHPQRLGARGRPHTCSLSNRKPVLSSSASALIWSVRIKAAGGTSQVFDPLVFFRSAPTLGAERSRAGRHRRPRCAQWSRSRRPC